MAGFLDFLGGAAGAYAQVQTEDRQRQQIEAYNARLREQELADYEAKEKIKQRLQAGTNVGTPQVTKTGQAVGFVYDDTGRNITMKDYGVVEGVADAYEAERAFEARKQELDLQLAQGKLGNLEYERAYKQAATSAAQARAFAATQSGLLAGEKRTNPAKFSTATANPRTEAFVEDRAIADEAAAQGLIYSPSSRRITDESEAAVDPAVREGIMSRATKGRSAANPVDVSTEAEADRLPPGTFVRIRGRIGVVE